MKILFSMSETSLRLAVSGLTLAVLSACGGGGNAQNSSASANTLNFSGTVAVGAALKNVVVSATCKNGATGQSAQTGDDGRYVLSINATLPCTFQAVEPVTGFIFRSLADADGTVNITPLSEMVFIFSNGDTANIVAAKTKLSSLMNSIGSPLAGDPLRTPFVANDTGLDKNIIDLVRLSTLRSGNIANPYTGLNNVSQAMSDGTCLVAPSTGTTFDSAGNPVIPPAVCPKLAVLAQFNQVFSPEIALLAGELFERVTIEIDSTLGDALTNYRSDAEWQAVFGYAAFDASKRGAYYYVGNFISKLKPSQVQSFAKRGSPMVRKIGVALKEKALGQFGTVSSDFLKLKNISNIGAGLVGGWFNDEIQDWLISTPLAEYAADINNGALGGLTAGLYGIAAYGVDIGTDIGAACAAGAVVGGGVGCAPAAAIAAGLAVPLDAIGWVAKDVKTIWEILQIRASTNDKAVELYVGAFLQAETDKFDKTSRARLSDWAKSGGTGNIASVLATELNTALSQLDKSILDGEKAAICTGFIVDGPCNQSLDPSLRLFLKQQKLDRLERMRLRFEKYAGACVALKEREGEQVGISNCLNLVNHNTAAPLFCPANKTLRAGECAPPTVTNVSQVSSNIAGLPQITFTITGTNLPTDIKFTVTTLLACNSVQTTWVSATTATATCTPVKGASSFNYTLSSVSTPNLDTTAITGIAGYGPSQVATISQVQDDVGPSQGALAQNALTDDVTPTINGTISAPLTAGQSVLIYDGANVLGRAAPTSIGLNWNFTPAVALPPGPHTLTAVVSTVDGIEGKFSEPWVIQVLKAGLDSFSPVTTGSTSSVISVGVDTTDGVLRLPLNTATSDSTFPFIWIANSGEGTISKLDTRTGKELGRYRTGPGNGNPSRTTVDQDGNVWVGNRANNTITKVGLKEYGQCIDRNGNGVIDTSTGATDVRAWGGSFGGSVSNAQDECILLHVAVTAPGVATPQDIRLIAIDKDNNLFTGGHLVASVFKVNGSTGKILTAMNTVGSVYGGFVDKEGNLWTSSITPYVGNGKVMTVNNALTKSELIDVGFQAYGIALDKYGSIWVSSAVSPNFASFNTSNPTGTLRQYLQQGRGYQSCYAQGVAVDDKDNVFIAGCRDSSDHAVGHYRRTIDGNGVVGAQFVANYVVAGGPTGVAVDGLGRVWSTNEYTNNVSRITLPTATTTVVVDSFPVGYRPYNYSDMTGRTVRNITNRQGTWEAVFDSDKTGNEWKKIVLAFKNEMPIGTSIEVSTKAADTVIGLGPVQYVNAVSEVGTSSFNLAGSNVGRFMKVKIRLLSSDPTKTPEITGLSLQ